MPLLSARPPLKMDPCFPFSVFIFPTLYFFLSLICLGGWGKTEKSKWRWFTLENFSSDFSVETEKIRYHGGWYCEIDIHCEFVKKQMKIWGEKLTPGNVIALTRIVYVQQDSWGELDGYWGLRNARKPREISITTENEINDFHWDNSKIGGSLEEAFERFCVTFDSKNYLINLKNCFNLQ